MVSPLVAVPADRLQAGRVLNLTSGAYAVPEPYIDSLRRAGARPLIVAPGEDDLEELLEEVDGVLLIGGGDVAPDRYGAGRHPALYGIDLDRDRTELDLARLVAKRAVPTLAICRGLQAANVAFGGTLFQHLPEVPGIAEHGPPGGGGPVLHDVKVAEGSRLSDAVRATTLSCASHHHQGVDRLARELVPVAWSGDGLVEAAEHREGWLLAVQWHPELTAARDPAQQALFDAFVERCRHRRQERVAESARPEASRLPGAPGRA